MKRSCLLLIIAAFVPPTYPSDSRFPVIRKTRSGTAAATVFASAWSDWRLHDINVVLVRSLNGGEEQRPDQARRLLANGDESTD